MLLQGLLAYARHLPVRLLRCLSFQIKFYSCTLHALHDPVGSSSNKIIAVLHTVLRELKVCIQLLHIL